MSSTVPLVLDLTHPRATDPALAGGKGAGLARLVAGGFPVPRGAVVTARCYTAFVAAWPELPALVEALPTGPGGRPEDLRDACAALRERLLARPLAPDIEAALRDGLAEACAAGPVGVRSSATLEDLAGAAFAGQHDTYLGIRGLDDAIDAVRRCWASLWEDRAVRYRLEKGFAPLAADMAVVVQEMVAADAAGVAFSLHPVTGETDRVLVTGAWGLGETVVAGEGEVDQWVIDRASREVLEAGVGAKSHELVLAEEGTEARLVPPERMERPCLTEGELAALVDLVLAVERHHGFPQDVEWAVRGGEVLLLQSRPVTEFPPRWTRAESAERFPNPITPLTWDFTTRGFHESLAHSLELMGLPPFRGEWFARFDGYVYGNQTAVEVFAAGHDAAVEDLEELAERVPELRERYRWVQELPTLWARDLDRYLLALGRLEAAPLADLPVADLWAHALQVDRVGREYFLPNIAISITQGLLHRLLFGLVARVVGPAEAPAAYDGLTCHCETKTGVVNRDLHELARLAERDGALKRALLEEDRRPLVESGRLDAHLEFREAFDRFLAVHGHREVEFDAYHPTWSGQPWVVLETLRLRLLLLQGEVQDPGVAEQEARIRQQVTERAFLARVPEHLRTFAGEITRLARAYTALDDLEHYQTTRLTPPFRAALVEIGRRLVEHGVLDEPEDVFFLRRDTLGAYVAGDVSAETSRAEAEENRAAHARQLETEPPFRWPPGEAREDAASAGAGAGGPAGTLRGLPGSPGVAEGPVRVLASADDFGRFRPGDVLVARTTNPAWTPLFYTAAAVVTESGGPLSHGAVTAREVGIPAVMGVRGALRALREGTAVRVDGGRGTVTVV